jgi:hypothetical protein
MLNDAPKLSECSVEHVFSKHPLSTGAVIQVFHEDHIPRITKRMGLLVVEVFSRVVDSVVKTSNFETLVASQKLNVNFRGIESRKINLGESMYPDADLGTGTALVLSLPQTPSKR